MRVCTYAPNVKLFCIILTGCRQGVTLPLPSHPSPAPTPKRTREEPIQIRVKVLSCMAHHNRLVSEQWTKIWVTVSSSKLQKEHSEVLRYRVLCITLYWKHRNLRVYCGNTWKSISMVPLPSQILKHSRNIFVRLL